MRELHVVALSEDGRHVVLATRAGAASGEFRVALDERLTAAVRGELPPPGRDAPPSISPRDIQARLRDGESPEQIAAAAGVPLSRVERYAGPVLAEVERMVTGARAAVVSRPRLGPSVVPLGEAVEARLAEVAHLAEGSVRWTARRTDVGQWVVEVSWTARGRRRSAGWVYDPAAREVTAVDGPSAVLGHLEAPAPAAAKRGARPAAAGPAGRTTRGRPQATPEASRTSGAAAAPGARPARTTAGAAQPAETAPATVRRVRPGPSAPAAGGGTRHPAPVVPDVPAPRRRAAAGTTPRPDTVPAAAPARRAPARGAPGQRRPDVPPAADRAQPRRPALKRRPVPSFDELAAPGDAVPPDSGPSATPESDPPGSDGTTREPVAAGPPVLRVVPPAGAPAPGPPAADAVEPPPARPARRAAGERGGRGGRDWADVLMGGAPAPPPAAGPPAD